MKWLFAKLKDRFQKPEPAPEDVAPENVRQFTVTEMQHHIYKVIELIARRTKILDDYHSTYGRYQEMRKDESLSDVERAGYAAIRKVVDDELTKVDDELEKLTGSRFVWPEGYSWTKMTPFYVSPASEYDKRPVVYNVVEEVPGE